MLDNLHAAPHVLAVSGGLLALASGFFVDASENIRVDGDLVASDPIGHGAFLPNNCPDCVTDDLETPRDFGADILARCSW